MEHPIVVLAPSPCYPVLSLFFLSPEHASEVQPFSASAPQGYADTSKCNHSDVATAVADQARSRSSRHVHVLQLVLACAISQDQSMHAVASTSSNARGQKPEWTQLVVVVACECETTMLRLHDLQVQVAPHYQTVPSKSQAVQKVVHVP